ncbi:hypothetical protein E1B28_008497 [Marasmius oreades]|uniref:Uncharacterized protein n=1 Tax=Marasmius oreades TaxID=181124 RepID=A0A9P7RZ41_9AGAR|nr:uncharacterized protein E1B28_008497 [Marasmius oreades]KAG7092123.1 hypothetical protein E1B28_008497 [Marasmius oreades]
MNTHVDDNAGRAAYVVSSSIQYFTTSPSSRNHTIMRFTIQLRSNSKMVGPRCISKPVRSQMLKDNYYRCPDGSLVLTQCEDRTYRMMRFSSLHLNEPSPVGDSTSSSRSTPTFLTLQQPAPIVDFLWYPTASPEIPASFCFASSVRDSPVKLLDASNGRLRASYPIIDHVERFVAPQSMAFNPYGTRLYCGFENAIEVFNVSQPGEGSRLMTTPNKQSKDGLKGIISALAFCPSYGSDYFVAGSLTPNKSNVAVFSETRGEIPVMFLGSDFRAGITQLMFNPMRPHLLYASFRRRTEILCWDLRTRVDIPWKIYSSSHRETTEDLTNQKRRFDVDISGRWLTIGGQNGVISIFDLNEPEDGIDQQYYEEPVRVFPSLAFEAHKDSITNTTFRPTSSHLLSISGSRYFSVEDVEDSNEEDDIIRFKRTRREPVVKDGSIKLWKF